MNAKEWLEQEELSNPKIMGSHPADDLFQGYDCSTVMERYANVVSRGWQVAILEFRNKILLNGGLSDFSILKKYDEHFEIRRTEHGTI